MIVCVSSVNTAVFGAIIENVILFHRLGFTTYIFKKKSFRNISDFCHLLITFAISFDPRSFSFSIYCRTFAFEHYRQLYIVHPGLEDESLQVTISKLP